MMIEGLTNQKPPPLSNLEFKLDRSLVCQARGAALSYGEKHGRSEKQFEEEDAPTGIDYN
jgi:hypothetical protein